MKTIDSKLDGSAYLDAINKFLTQKSNGYSVNNSDRGSDPRLYDDGRRWVVDGRTSRDESYEVTFLGENPFNDPKKYGETDKSLLGKIKAAAERSSEECDLLNKLGLRGTQGVIVAGPNYLVSPKPGVQVVNIEPEPLQI